MKKVLLLLLLAGLTLGCDKLKGEKGDKGDPGQDADAKTYNGVIVDDWITVNIPELKADEMPVINVYVSDGSGRWVEIPCYNYTLYGQNVVAIISYGKVEIVNARSAQMTQYYIVLASYPKAPVYKSLMRG